MAAAHAALLLRLSSRRAHTRLSVGVTALSCAAVCTSWGIRAAASAAMCTCIVLLHAVSPATLFAACRIYLRPHAPCVQWLHLADAQWVVQQILQVCAAVMHPSRTCSSDMFFADIGNLMFGFQNGHTCSCVFPTTLSTVAQLETKSNDQCCCSSRQLSGYEHWPLSC